MCFFQLFLGGLDGYTCIREPVSLFMCIIYKYGCGFHFSKTLKVNLFPGFKGTTLTTNTTPSNVHLLRDVDLSTSAVIEKSLCVLTVSQVSKNKKHGTREPSYSDQPLILCH